MGKLIVNAWTLVLFLSGAAIFLLGFFPISYQQLELHGEKVDEFGDLRPTQLNGIRIHAPQRKYKRTVLMIIDAFRYDFPTPDSMPFASRNACLQIDLQVDIPTVTMPRLKSLTTGTISSFIDIVLNLGSSEELSDSILHGLRGRGDVIAFAGDRTWVNLFPNQLNRQYPNIDSFFVNDFYEGDRNVTKVLTKELLETDWTLLILHYLGLDHIGHVEGTDSSKIPAKLQEMDEVVRQVYESNHLRDQLLLVTGDHGMRNGGGHGGSTFEELHVPLLVHTEFCDSNSSKPLVYNQIDLAPTLAVLLSIPIPKSSIGCLITELLEHFTLEEQLYAHHYNTYHLIRKAFRQFDMKDVVESTYFAWYRKAILTHEQFLVEERRNGSPSNFLFEKSKLNYVRASQKISGLLSEFMVRFDYALIVIGLCLTTLTTLFAVISLISTSDGGQLYVGFFRNKLALVALSTAVVFKGCCHIMEYLMHHSFWVTIPIAACIYLLLNICKVLSARSISLGGLMPSQSLLFIAPFLIYVLSLTSSSFIECEQQTWYYLGTSILIAMLFHLFRTQRNGKEILSSIQILTSIRDTFANLGILMLDIVVMTIYKRLTASVWTSDGNILYTSVMCGIGLCSLILQLRKLITPLQLVIATVAILCTYCYRGVNGSLMFPPHTDLKSIYFVYLFWIGIAVFAVLPMLNVPRSKTFSSKRLLTTLLSCSLLIAAFLHKPHNVILVSVMFSTLEEGYKLCHHIGRGLGSDVSVIDFNKTVLTLFIANLFFFVQGNSNSLATIDLNPGYIGQSNYNPLIVGTFVTLNTYSSPINAFLQLVLHIKTKESNNVSHESPIHGSAVGDQAVKSSLQLVMSTYTIATIVPVAIYLCLLVFFRYHLFIYSVFAPKALYACFGVVVFFVKFSLTNLFLLTTK